MFGDQIASRGSSAHVGVAVFLVLGGPIGCGDPTTSPSDPSDTDEPRPTSVVVSPNRATLNALGETVRFTAEVRDQNGVSMGGVAVAWTSSDPSVVTVDGTGLARASGRGEASVGASVGSVSGTAAVRVSLPDHAVLEALYDGLGGPDWTNNARWLSGAPPGEWWGVTTDSVSGWRVTGVDLPNNNLHGAIPPSLNGLAALELLDLHGNRLAGEIPPSLGELPELEVLSLRNNELTGGIPSSLGRLAKLKELNLRLNSLNGSIPSSLGDLEDLELLSLRSNQLSGEIPASLGELTSLEELALYDNQLTGGIPSSLGGMASLSELYLHKNGLSGAIPGSLGDLTQLTRLYAHENRLNGEIPPALGRLSKLEQLSLRDNELSGPIPSALGGMAALEILYLHDNELTGSIPAALGDLVLLEELSLRSNELTGPVPSSFGQLIRLRHLWLNYNPGLSGPLPVELTRAADLETLDLRETGVCVPATDAFTGWLERIATRRGVVRCDHANDLAALRALYDATTGSGWTVNSNWLTDEPLGVWHGVGVDAATGRVAVVDLRTNNLSGAIPSAFSTLSSLEVLYLHENSLTGEIPSSLGTLTRLREMSLRSNQLTGPVPVVLGDLADLEHLWLNYNPGLTGPLPLALTKLASLATLDVRGTGLCAPADESFQAWLRGITTARGVVTCAP
ncbi:MAG: hypothetical protein F4205_17885 [Gemmatimonadetes bacterium]|nr:hypothetical protein [Gemmatimonadota bacterium]